MSPWRKLKAHLPKLPTAHNRRIGSLAVQRLRWPPEKYTVPAVARDKLVEHSFIISSRYEAVVNVKIVSDEAPDTVATSLPLFHTGRIPFKVVVDDPMRIGMEINAFRSDVARHEHPRRADLPECGRGTIAVPAIVVTRVSLYRAKVVAARPRIQRSVHVIKASL